MAKLQIGLPEEVASGRVVRLVRRHCVGPTGKPIDWESVERNGVQNIAAVFAVTLERKVVLVDQIRPSFGERGQHVLDLPAGLVDLGEEPKAAAKRELLEETGYHVDITYELPIGPECAGLSNCRVHTFIASDAIQQRGGLELREESEQLLDLKVVELVLNDLPDALTNYQVATGALIDPKIAMALAYYRAIDFAPLFGGRRR